MRRRPLLGSAPLLPPVLAVAALSAVGCAPGPGTTERVRAPAPDPAGVTIELVFPDDFPGEREHVAVYITTVREAVLAAYEDLGFGVDTASHATVVATPRLQIRGQIFEGEPNSRYLDCGVLGDGRPAADVRRDPRLRMYTILSPTDQGETSFETRIVGEAGPGGVRGTIACTGTGILERRLNQRVLEALPSS